jgi:hypothetical protein
MPEQPFFDSTVGFPTLSTLVNPATLRTKAVRHARISTGIVRIHLGNRAAPLPDMRAESNAAVEARSGTLRLRLPYI